MRFAGSAALGVAVLVVGVILVVAPVDTQGAAARAAQPPPPVVFLLLDELPSISLEDENGNIDAGRFPNFARLASSSIWFRNMTAISSATVTDVPALLTGQRPKKGSRPVYADHPNNLFTLLGKSYRLHVFETETRLCPSRLCKRKPTSNTNFTPRLHLFRDFLAALKPPGATPALDYLHVLYPHGPWLYLQDGRVRAVENTRAPGRTEVIWYNEAMAEQAFARHLTQLGFTDVLLGRFLDGLQATGLWDKALIVVTVDEGDSFRGGDDRRRPTKTNFGDIAFIPTFVKLPGSDQAGVVDKHVSSLDILPTIAEALGVKVGWHMDGQSAFAPGEGSQTVHLNTFSMPLAKAEALREKARQRKFALFGSGTWGPLFAGTGRYRGLVGQPLSALKVARASPAKATVDSVGSRLLRLMPANSARVPSPLMGTMAGTHTGAAIAFALNGRIAAVSAVYRERGKLRFSVLPGEDAFRTGHNSVRAFAVTGTASSPVLHQLKLALSR